MKKKIIYVVSAIFVVLVLFITAEVSGIFKNKSAISIDIPSGCGTREISRILKDNKIISSENMFYMYSRVFGGTFQKGTHEITSKSYWKICEELESVTLSKSVTVTIPEGMEQREIAALIEVKGLVTAEEFNDAAKIDKYDYWFLKNIPVRDMQLEGYLFPDTYEFAFDESAESIIMKMLDNFDKKFTAEMKKQADKLGMTTDEIIIMASVVEREVASKNELGLVSGVFYNRLNPNTESAGYLQSCATVQYILKERKKVLSIADTEIKSDYNTYVKKGLPVGPIASPGLNCINAALNPQKTEYMYFAADGDGKHYFAETYDKHLKNMKKAGLM